MPDRSAANDLAERAMRSTLLTLSHRKSLGRLATRVPITRPMVRRFISGETLGEALPAIRRLRDAGMGTTVDVLGESVTAEADARAAADRYVALLDALAQDGVDRNVSLKPSQMGLAIDRGLARENVGRVVAKAIAVGAFVRIDMEDHTTTDATLALWQAVRPVGAHEDGTSGADVGLVIQAALRRSDRDVDAMIEAGGRVRLCKGAYKEPHAVAYAEKAEVDDAYERLMLRLMRSGRYPAIATHDVRLIKRAIEVAKAEGIARDAFEFQMLYGIRRDLQEQLVGAGWRVRVYVPFGAQWYPYFMRRLAERPANVTFLLRNMWRDRGAS
ncbi:MAG: proline dehydrogenase family protein [Candidatus Limnocylindrales bacterium]